MKIGEFEKSELKAMNFHGFTWYAYENGLHYFERKDSNGHLEMVCEPQQLANGDAEYMAKNGLTLSPSRIKKNIRKYIRSQRSNNLHP